MIERINWDKLDKLESIARKYLVSADMDSFFERLNLPRNLDTQQQIFVKKKDKLKGLFTSILDISDINLYGNFGMFLLESYTGNSNLAEKYALVGIAYNKFVPETHELRSSLAEFYEQRERKKEANELYIENINITLVNMKFSIDNFLEENGQKLLFSGIRAEIVQGKNENPLNTYLNTDVFSKYAVQSQSKETRQKFADAKRLHDCGHYQMANETLKSLDYEFSDYEMTLCVGLLDLTSQVHESFDKRMAKVIKTLSN